MVSFVAPASEVAGFFAAVFGTLPLVFFAAVFLAAFAGGAVTFAGAPCCPKKVVSDLCILPAAAPTADSTFKALALVLKGRAPAGRASIRQRLSA